jgi:hypothetical protein
MPPDLVFSGGRNWVRTSDPSLVRRNTARNTPSSPCWFMHLTCGNRARRCPEVPGRVCTVVPASGSRSSLLTPRLKSELGLVLTASGWARCPHLDALASLWRARTRAEHLTWASILGVRAHSPPLPAHDPIVRLGGAARPQRHLQGRRVGPLYEICDVRFCCFGPSLQAAPTLEGWRPGGASPNSCATCPAKHAWPYASQRRREQRLPVEGRRRRRGL